MHPIFGQQLKRIYMHLLTCDKITETKMLKRSPMATDNNLGNTCFLQHNSHTNNTVSTNAQTQSQYHDCLLIPLSNTNTPIHISTHTYVCTHTHAHVHTLIKWIC